MKKINYQPKQVRLFLFFLLVFLFLLTFRLTRTGSAQERFIFLAAIAATIAIFMAFPRLFFPAFKVVMIGSSQLGNFIFAVLSIIIFFLILTPIALVMKLAGKKFMKPRSDPSLPSYYEDAEDRTDVKKQF
jgi:hypothetical protein